MCHRATMETHELKMKHWICFLREVCRFLFQVSHIQSIGEKHCPYILRSVHCVHLSPTTLMFMKTVKELEFYLVRSKMYSVLTVAMLYHRRPGVSCLRFGLAGQLTVGLLRHAFYICWISSKEIFDFVFASAKGKWIKVVNKAKSYNRSNVQLIDTSGQVAALCALASPTRLSTELHTKLLKSIHQLWIFWLIQCYASGHLVCWSANMSN